MSIHTHLQKTSNCFIVYGARDVGHIRQVLLPALVRQNPPQPLHICLFNYHDSTPAFSASDSESYCTIEDYSSNRPLPRLGFGQSINHLFRVAPRADQFFILNPDTVPHESFCATLSMALKSGEVGIAEGMQWPAEHPKEYHAGTGETPWASGACLLISSKAFEDTKGFDENFFLYCEDVDLSWRMWLAGWKVCYVPDALCQHHTGMFSYRSERFYYETFHSALGYLMLSYKYRGAAGEREALSRLDETGYPVAFRERVRAAWQDQRSSVQPIQHGGHQMIRFEGYNVYHTIRADYNGSDSR